MPQHFLLSAHARTLSVAKVARMSDEEARGVFCKIRWADITQTANRATLNLDRDGTGSKATIMQLANGATATVNQKGLTNMAAVDQNAIDGIVNVTQDGE